MRIPLLSIRSTDAYSKVTDEDGPAECGRLTPDEKRRAEALRKWESKLTAEQGNPGQAAARRRSRRSPRTETIDERDNAQRRALAALYVSAYFAPDR